MGFDKGRKGDRGGRGRDKREGAFAEESVGSDRGGFADRGGFGAHIPKGYIYTAMAFSGGVEILNIWARNKRARASGASQ